MGEQITNYTERKRKLQVQSEIYSKINPNTKTFIGLPGPNIIEYLDKINYKRFNKVIFYEIDKSVFENISEAIANKPEYKNIKIFNESINLHLGRTKAFYDLDYCKTLSDIREHLPRIAKIEEFSITFCTRKVKNRGLNERKVLAGYLEHEAFVHKPYRDGCPMVAILVSKRLFA